MNITPPYLLFLSVLTLSLSSLSHADDFQRANQYFENGMYEQARDAYLQPAMDRNKFAQYRIGLIDYFGLAGERDKVSAYAWISVASEPLIPILAQIQSLIDDELSHQERRRARELAIEYDRKYGVTIVMQQNPPSRVRGGCTGSRLGVDCDRLDNYPVSGSANPRSRPRSRVGREVPAQAAVEFNKAYNELIFEEFNRFDGTE